VTVWTKRRGEDIVKTYNDQYEEVWLRTVVTIYTDRRERDSGIKVIDTIDEYNMIMWL
jgi:hypothetical protein